MASLVDIILLCAAFLCSSELNWRLMVKIHVGLGTPNGEHLFLVGHALESGNRAQEVPFETRRLLPYR